MGKNAQRRRQRRAAEQKHGTRVVRHRDGSRTIHLNQELIEAVQEQLQRFEVKFGHPPRPEDPIFFDPDEDVPTPMSELKIEAIMVSQMQELGVDPAFIYAFQQTGLLVNEANLHLLTEEDIQEWDDAVGRYRLLHSYTRETGFDV